MNPYRIAIIIPLLGYLSLSSYAENEKDLLTLTNLVDLRLEDLLQIEIYSAGKKDSRYMTTPAAVTVLDHSFIERSGANTFPELLRYVPGFSVAQLDSTTTAVNVRNPYDLFSDKLLVLLDGRPLYNPQFSGTYWNNQDTFFEDIEQIEAIRGPGATLWGSNAVDGVINIRTKGAEKTHGTSMRALFGSDGEVVLSARYGGKLKDDLHYRIYTKYRDFGNFEPLDQTLYTQQPYDGRDGSVHRQIGGRFDYLVSDSIRWTSDFGYYETDSYAYAIVPDISIGPPFYSKTEDNTFNSIGGWLSLSWERKYGDNAHQSFKTFIDYTKKEDLKSGFYFENYLYNLEYNQTLEWGEAHVLDFGAEARLHVDESFRANSGFGFGMENYRASYTLYAQNEFKVIEDRLSLQIGLKSDYNEYTSWAWQPSLRIKSQLSDQQFLWFAVSHAIHAPTQTDRETTSLKTGLFENTFGGYPYRYSLEGNPEYKSEKLNAYELGWRKQFGEFLFVDVAIFYNRYYDLPDFSFSPARELQEEGVTFWEIPMTFVNASEAENYGLELSINWQINPAWQITANYAYLYAETMFAVSFGEKIVRRDAPRHTFNLLTSYNIGDELRFDLGLRYVSDVEYFGFIQQDIPEYWSLDFQLSWKMSRSWELLIRGKNLGDSPRLEYISPLSENTPMQVMRSFELGFRFEY